MAAEQNWVQLSTIMFIVQHDAVTHSCMPVEMILYASWMCTHMQWTWLRRIPLCSELGSVIKKGLLLYISYACACKEPCLNSLRKERVGLRTSSVKLILPPVDGQWGVGVAVLLRAVDNYVMYRSFQVWREHLCITAVTLHVKEMWWVCTRLCWVHVHASVHSISFVE